MAWLHGLETCIMHRDLKLSNLLYDKNMRVKLSDFNLSTIKSRKKMRERDPAGTALYMAPELLAEESFNEKVDVYSFALVLWYHFLKATSSYTLYQATCYQ